MWLLGSSLIAVAPYQVSLPDLDAETISLRAAPDQLVAGSYLTGKGQGGILLLHGIHGDLRLGPIGGPLCARLLNLSKHGFNLTFSPYSATLTGRY
jgi:hypothetical protein